MELFIKSYGLHQQMPISLGTVDVKIYLNSCHDNWAKTIIIECSKTDIKWILG